MEQGSLHVVLCKLDVVSKYLLSSGHAKYVSKVVLF